jgi:hypothetical protein
VTTRATRIRRRGAPPALVGVLASLILLAGASAPPPALAGETAGFWYGADSGAPGPANSDPPYYEPSCGAGHKYGGYIGKIGGADLVSSSNPSGYGPGNTFAWNSSDAAAADTDHFRYGYGVGSGGYWFLFGPGNTDGTGLSPMDWGQQQARWALADWQRWYDNGEHRMPLLILWMDIEVPGSYGWGSNGAANREVFNGFWDAVAHAPRKDHLRPGVYSTNYQWGVIMRGHTSIPHTWEWTAQVSVANSPAPCPGSFQASSWQFADFFGSQTQTSRDTAMWQWSLGSADYDQIDRNKPLPVTMP